MVLGFGFTASWATGETPSVSYYRNVPHFKASTAPGHKGRLVFGTLRGRNVAVMQGRMHRRGLFL